MQTIVKWYKITKWCNYQEVHTIPAINTDPSYTCHTALSGHPTYIQQWLDEITGEGLKSRTFDVYK